MNRIKFRAYDSANKIMMHDYQWIDLPRSPCMGGGVHRSFVFTSNGRNTVSGSACSAHHEVMQWTGLIDANEKKIFEGDVLQIKDDFAESVFVGSVQFHEGVYGLENRNGERIRFWHDGMHEHYSIGIFNSFDIVVVGNIYENAEPVKD